MKERFTEEQIIAALKRVESGTDVKTLCRELGVHMQTIYVWKKKCAGMEVSDARRMKALIAENQKLKRRVVADLRDERRRSVSRACRTVGITRDF